MDNPTTITVEMPPRLLDLLETYVRARIAVFVEHGQGIEGQLSRRAAEQMELLAGDLALFQLMLQMRELGVGTLGEALAEWSKQVLTKNQTFELIRADELAAVEDGIYALNDAPDLDSLWNQQRKIRDRLMTAWPTLIDDDEYDGWLDELSKAASRREREL